MAYRGVGGGGGASEDESVVAVEKKSFSCDHNQLFDADTAILCLLWKRRNPVDKLPLNWIDANNCLLLQWWRTPEALRQSARCIFCGV